MVRAGYKERDMSKTNDSSFTLDLVSNNDSSFTLDLGGDVTGTTWRLLRDDELLKVSAGLKADSNEVAVEGFVRRAFGGATLKIGGAEAAGFAFVEGWPTK
jgi:hypothetical protein